MSTFLYSSSHWSRQVSIEEKKKFAFLTKVLFLETNAMDQLKIDYPV